jgi:hypothetical protein
MKVLALQPARHVLWQVVDGPKEWIGTKVSWETPGLEGAGVINASLQHQVGDFSDELEVACRNRERRPVP